MPSYYDDNYGHYEIDSQEDIDFYHAVQKRSVTKTCLGCGRTVRLQPQYGYCDSCATARERGIDI